MWETIRLGIYEAAGKFLSSTCPMGLSAKRLNYPTLCGPRRTQTVILASWIRIVVRDLTNHLSAHHPEGIKGWTDHDA